MLQKRRVPVRISVQRARLAPILTDAMGLMTASNVPQDQLVWVETAQNAPALEK